jgi:hypothetical protein
MNDVMRGPKMKNLTYHPSKKIRVAKDKIELPKLLEKTERKYDNWNTG